MTLYEHFNTSQQTSPHFERHENFVTDISRPTCAMLMILPHAERCPYVKNTSACMQYYLINYTEFLFCTIKPNNALTWVCSVILLLLICLMIFFVVGRTAREFFCPSLKVLSQIMGLSENVAGVTLLAFGNSANDAFTNFVSLSSTYSVMYSDIFGGAMFVMFIVAGWIIVIEPFKLHPSSFLRDICFLLLAVLLVDYCIKNHNSVTVGESIVILSLYFVYIFVVIMDQFLLKRQTKRMREELVHASFDSTKTRRFEALNNEAHIEIMRRRTTVVTATVLPIFQDSFSFAAAESGNANLLQQFYKTLHPLDMPVWRENGYLLRCFQIIRIPHKLILRILIPVVDYELEDHGWSKLLNCMHLVITPVLVCLCISGPLVIYYLPVYLWVAIAMAPFAIYIFIVTRTDTTPRYHRFISILGILGSIFVIYACAKETMRLFDTIGITSSRSNSFLGCTLLAWGINIGDFISNIELAKQGYQRMGFAACFGGPLFNALFSVGVMLLYKSLKSVDFRYSFGEGTLGENSTIFLEIGLFWLLLGIVTTNFVVRRSIGIFMILWYLLFLLWNLLGEFNCIHTYGSDHRMDLRVDPANF